MAEMASLVLNEVNICHKMGVIKNKVVPKIPIHKSNFIQLKLGFILDFIDYFSPLSGKSLSRGRGTSASLLLREKGLGDEGQSLHNSFRLAIFYLS
jgi:hypothetical protein